MTTDNKLLQRARRLISRAHELLEASEKKNRYGSPISDITRELFALEDECDRVEGVKSGPKRTPYKSETRKTHGNNHALRESHESFGILGIHRVSGSGGRLYGSHLPSHHNFIVLRIYRSLVEHSLSRDHHYADGRMPIVEVSMSAAQFAEAITTLNHGDGVPCTIVSVDGVTMDEVPESVATENEKIVSTFKSDIADRVQGLRDVYAEIDRLVEAGSSVSKGRARELRDVVKEYLNRIDRDAGFVVTQFNRSAEKVVTHAKAEIESMMNLAIHNAGVKTIADGDGGELKSIPEVGS